MVIDDVDDDFDAAPVEALHHLLEFTRCLASGGRQSAIRSEIRQRVVAPVVGHPASGELHLVDPLVHGHELDGRDAKRLEMRHRRVGGEPEKGAALLGRHGRMKPGEPLHVKLVKNRVMPGDTGRLVAFPVERVVDDDRLRLACRVVSVIGRKVAQAPVTGKAVHGPSRVEAAVESASVGVDQQLGGTEAVPVARRERTMDTPAVALPRPEPANVEMPDVERPPRNAHARLRPGLVEQAEINGGRVLAEQGEINAPTVPGGPERVKRAGVYPEWCHE